MVQTFNGMVIVLQRGRCSDIPNLLPAAPLTKPRFKLPEDAQPQSYPASSGVSNSLSHPCLWPRPGFKLPLERGGAGVQPRSFAAITDVSVLAYKQAARKMTSSLCTTAENKARLLAFRNSLLHPALHHYPTR